MAEENDEIFIFIRKEKTKSHQPQIFYSLGCVWKPRNSISHHHDYD